MAEQTIWRLHCRVTNPHEFTVDGVHMLGTSGQNVDDVAKYSSHEDGLQLLGACLEWAHLAPTGPDTLTVYPFKNSDPFVLNQAPHVMFVGNQAKFQTDLFSSGKPQPLLTMLAEKAESGAQRLIRPVNLHLLPHLSLCLLMQW